MLSEKKETGMSAKLQRLHSLYGPFVRFTPEGTEGNDDKNAALDDAIKTGEDAAKTPDEQKAIDDARKAEQQLEQEQSNTRRANEATRQAQSNLEAAQSENDNLKEQLETAQAKADLAGIQDVTLNEDDYETVSDRKLVKAIKNIEAKQSAKDAEIASLAKKAAGYEQRELSKQAKAVSKENYEELLTGLDKDYGADCRNEAVTNFNALADAGKVDKGKPSKATRALEQCYKAVKAAKDKAKAEADKKNLDLDTGSGGGSAVNLTGTEIKEGSLDEVDAQIAKTEVGSRKA